MTDAGEYTVTSGDAELAVFDHGGPAGAPTVILVHGYPDTHSVWDGVVAHLAGEYRVVTFDTRGIGRSSGPRTAAGYTLPRLAGDVRAVADAVSPDRPVHLVGHDWGSILCWEAVTDPVSEARYASFTSVSGPCLDHVGYWVRDAGWREPRRLAKRVAQGSKSWYIGAFQLPVVPRVMWHLGAAASWPAIRRRQEGVDAPVAGTLAADGSRGVLYYRANMLRRVRQPRQRWTKVPVQVVAPTRDKYVTPALAAEAPRPWTERLWVRRLPTGHWLPLRDPVLMARCISELIIAVEGGSQSRALRRAMVGPDDASPPEFADRLVVVTGAGGGIGRATALAFAELGAEIVAADIDQAAAERTAELARLSGDGGHAYRVDVADADAMAAFAQWVRERHGVPDIVVNNAGIGMAGPFLETGLDDWHRVVDVNLWGVIHGCRLFGAMLAERGEGGHIVNVASAAAYLPSRMLPAYSTTKAAVLMLSQCLRAELGGQAIGVSVICPGFVNTGIGRAARFVGTDEAEQQRIRGRVAMLFNLRGYPAERVATRIVRAVRDNTALVPVTAEARGGLALARLSPGLLRALARVDITPR